MFDKGTLELSRLKLNNWAGTLGSWLPNPTNNGAVTEIKLEEFETFRYVTCWGWVEAELGLLTAKIKSWTSRCQLLVHRNRLLKQTVENHVHPEPGLDCLPSREKT